MLMPTKMLAPTDFSEYSDRTVVQALDIAKEYHAKVFLLHVIHLAIFPGTWDYSHSRELMQHIKDEQGAEIKERLQNQLHKFPQTNEVEVVSNIREGIPYE